MDFDIDDMFAIIRRVLSNVTKTKYSDDVLLDHLNDGLHNVRVKRTDAWIDDDGNLIEYARIINITESLPINDKWKTYLMDYILYACFSEMPESESSETRALKHLKLYQQQIKEI